jgi:hypothetical protein
MGLPILFSLQATKNIGFSKNGLDSLDCLVGLA